jgi:hypothetical protein
MTCHTLLPTKLLGMWPAVEAQISLNPDGSADHVGLYGYQLPHDAQNWCSQLICCYYCTLLLGVRL